MRYSYLPSAGEIRNDLYVTLERGEFEKGGKSVARNVEVTVYLLGGDGQLLKVRTGTGCHLFPAYKLINVSLTFSFQMFYFLFINLICVQFCVQCFDFVLLYFTLNRF